MDSEKEEVPDEVEADWDQAQAWGQYMIFWNPLHLVQHNKETGHHDHSAHEAVICSLWRVAVKLCCIDGELYLRELQSKARWRDYFDSICRFLDS